MELRNRRIFVTGADGFIGSHLVERLITEGAKVKALSAYNSYNSWGWLDAIPKDIINRVEVISGDVRDEGFLMDAVKGSEIVFHLASLIAIPYSYIAPASYIETNIKGTLNVLQACRGSMVEKVIHTSTSEVYGSAQYVPIDELHPLQGQSPYSASKIGADMLAESYYRSFGTPVAIIRPFNTYGPRQSARAIIPTIVSQILLGSRSLRLGALSPTRDFNYVIDTVSGFIDVAKSDATTGTVTNIGTGKEISIGNLAKLIADIVGVEIEISTEEHRLRPSKSEVSRLCASNDKARRLTNWTPQFTLEEGLKNTIQWIQNNQHVYKEGIYNL